MAQQLGDEEGIAVRLTPQRVSECHAGLVHLVAGRGLYQFEDLVVPQATEVDPVHRRLAVQVGQQHRERMARAQIARPVGSDDQAPQVPAGPEKVTEQRKARGIGPLQVVEDDEDRGVRTRQLEGGGDGLDQEELLGVRLGLHRLLRREKTRLGRQQPAQRPGVDRRKPLEGGRLGVAHQVGEGPHPGQIGRVRPFGALAEEHRDALAVRTLRCVRGQAGLAHPGFAGDEGDSQPSLGRRLLAQLGQQRQLGVAPGESEEPSRGVLGEAHREGHSGRAVLPRRLPTRFDRGDRGGEALQLEGPERAEFERGVTAHGEAQQLGGQDLAGCGQGTQTGGLDHGVPEEVALFFDGLSGGQTDPDLEHGVAATVVAIERLLDLDGAGERPTCARKDDHQPVAEVLHFPATG